MGFNPLVFDPHILRSMVGGLSVLDIPHIGMISAEHADQFLTSYGYDIKKEDDLQRIWSYHRKAITYIQTELLSDSESIPKMLTDPEELGPITNLFLIASSKGSELQRWACGILKVMHIYVHLENDLFAQFSKDIQDQILGPIQSHIHEDPILGTLMGPAMGQHSIQIKKFEMKAFKTSYSSVTKLLAKRELLAFQLLDKVGVRIVTRHLVDVFRVLKYLTGQSLISFPHNIPDQSNNTLYPLNYFFDVVESLNRDIDYTSEELDQRLKEKLTAEKNKPESEQVGAEYKAKLNSFSSDDYRFMKFITRRLVRIRRGPNENDSLNFFYPFEIQIVDYETHLKNMNGHASHDKYKERQIRMARARVLGFGVIDETH
jgi:uncharacterized protein (TIGR04552 family)